MQLWRQSWRNQEEEAQEPVSTPHFFTKSALSFSRSLCGALLGSDTEAIHDPKRNLADIDFLLLPDVPWGFQAALWFLALS